MKHERLRMAHHSNMCSNCGAPLPGGGLCTSCEDRKLKESPEYKIQTLESKLAEAEACITIKNLDLRHVIYERDRLRLILTTLLTLDRWSCDVTTGLLAEDRDGPWVMIDHKAIEKALAPAPEEKK